MPISMPFLDKNAWAAAKPPLRIETNGNPFFKKNRAQLPTRRHKMNQ